MKKAIIVLIMMLFMTSNVQAKNILVPQNKCTYEYLQKHKSDTIYVYVYGTRIKENGDGKIRGANPKYNYIKYRKGNVNTKFTTLYQLRKGSEDVDDIVTRIDYKGWSKPRLN